MPERPMSPPWITPLNVGIVFACLASVVLAAVFQHQVIIGSTPDARFFIVPSFVGLFFGVLLVVVKRMAVLNQSYGRRLAERNEQIETLNRDLEKRVMERTEELSAKHEQLLQAQRLEIIGQLVGGVAHDLNNLLMVIRGNVELLGVRDDDKALISDVLDATERGQRLTNSLITTSRRPRAPAKLLLDELVDELAGMLQRAFGKAYSIDVQHGATPAPSVDAEDNGPGVPPEIQSRIFDTFFTTKSDGKGSGLGLSTVKLLVSEVGGTIELRAGAKGACFRVELPATTAA